jgi:hypothetical protein
LDLLPLWLLNGYTEVLTAVFPLFVQEFYDEWPVKLGDVPPYSGPKTPDGRVKDRFSFDMIFAKHSALSSTALSMAQSQPVTVVLCVCRKSSSTRLLTIS